MRYMIFGIFFVSTIAAGGTPPNRMSKAEFEQKFKEADKNQDGVLSRQEAYAKFPKAPKFFDQIDSNKDGQVSLAEVKAAMERSVDAAISAGVAAKRYPGAAGTAAGGAASGADVPEFASEAEARDHHAYRYYDSLVSSEERALDRGEAVRAEPVPNLLQKPF